MQVVLPRPYPDETLYSMIARYRRHSALVGQKETLEDVFGDRSVRASTDLQCHLSSLARRLHPAAALTAERLARKFTLLPYYIAFQPPQVVEIALRMMIAGPGDGLYFRLAVSVGKVRPPEFLRFCPVCHTEAKATHGERYWRRVHQLPGVLVCEAHGVPLQDSLVRISSLGQHEFIPATGLNCPHATPVAWKPCSSSMALLAELAAASAELLEAPPLLLATPEMQRHIAAKIEAAGIALPSGRVDQKALHELQQDSLHPLASILPAALDRAWIAAMTRKHRRAFHPLYHLLLDAVLERSRPWNRIPRPAGAPRHFLADDPMFLQGLQEEIAAGHGLRSTARSLGVDAKTVRRHAHRLGLATGWKAPDARNGRNVLKERDQAARHRWLAAAAANPLAGRTDLRRMLPADHAWLYRNDREWLDAHSPMRVARPPPRARLDWAGIDSALCGEFAQAAVRLRAGLPPMKVTKAALEREVSRPGWIASRRDKLPRSVKVMIHLVETPEDFRARCALYRQQKLESARETAQDRDTVRPDGCAPAGQRVESK